MRPSLKNWVENKRGRRVRTANSGETADAGGRENPTPGDGGPHQ